MNGYPERKSPRADFHDYCGGTYFVTLCTREMKCYFGHIKNAEMFLTEIGMICEQKIAELATAYDYLEIPQYVVMPNHVHLIAYIDYDKYFEKTGREPKRSILSFVIGNLKRDVTMYARMHYIDFGWQKRFHDHIIRGSFDGNNISRYIDNNVAAWETDCFYQ